MTHASVELIRAMAGEAPPVAFDPKLSARLACGPAAYGLILWARVGINNAYEPTGVVTCPACLVRMDAAMEGTVLP